MNICELKKCTGCAACINTCKHESITMTENEQGFFYPLVDETKCINCNLCKQVCPVNHPTIPNFYMQVYAALVKDDSERAKSTSGGIFACLAKKVLKAGGYVYGAILDKDLVVRHTEAHSIEELNKQRNSKYVQSDIGLSYRLAKMHLDNGEQVLFSGTPCQIAGLKNYLRKDYSNLLLVDILCHGVPSPGFFRKYISSEEQIASSKMRSIQFRTKIIGWKENVTVREFLNGETADWPDTFVPGFLQDYYLRESCYNCVYASDRRQGDISLGDYWGYQEMAPDYIEDDDKGISLVIINTKKGKRAFRNIGKKIAFSRRTISDAKRENTILYKPGKKPNNYSDFHRDAQNMSWRELSDKYIRSQVVSDWIGCETRDYYNVPFSIRHRKHIIRVYASRVYHRLLGDE